MAATVATTRALAQRVEVADKEVRIMGSKSELLRTLMAASRAFSGKVDTTFPVRKRDKNKVLELPF